MMALLVSQQSLVERLLHNASYVEQLQLLCGESGSGKTTLLTAVSQQANESLCAYVACPEHADDAEIRRKIWVQLLDAPVFDDELSLADTLLSVQDDIQQPLIILLDDAQRLSLTLLAELITLSQMRMAGQPVAVITAVSPDLVEMLETELDANNEVITTLHIESLTKEEQHSLYLLLMGQQAQGREQTLSLSDFGADPIFPVDVVKKLNSEADRELKPASSPLMKYTLALAVVVLTAVTFWQLNHFHDEQETKPMNATAKVGVAGNAAELVSTSIKPQVETTLPKKESRHPNTLIDIPVSRQHSPSASMTQKVLPQVSLGKKQEHIEDSVSDHTHEELKRAKDGISTKPEAVVETPKATLKLKTADVKTAKPVEQSKKVIKEVKQPSFKPKYPQGYTLQIATMRHKDSLEKLLKKLDGWKGIKVAKHNLKWVIVLGDFKSRKAAQQTIAKLKSETRLPAPWLRKWSALKDYNFQ